jgi:hypothetical protein
MSMKKLAVLALQVQDASNLSGVVHSWSTTITALRKLLPNAGTDEINRHPVNVMFADKVADLTGSRNTGNFVSAYDECVRLSNLPDEPPAPSPEAVNLAS